MSSELALPQNKGLAESEGGGNGYSGLQRKLDALTKALDAAHGDLEHLVEQASTNANTASAAASLLEAADGDPRYVERTGAVATALTGATKATVELRDLAGELAAKAAKGARTHQQKYGALHDVRSRRRTKTPKPGFLED